MCKFNLLLAVLKCPVGYMDALLRFLMDSLFFSSESTLFFKIVFYFYLCVF